MTTLRSGVFAPENVSAGVYSVREAYAYAGFSDAIPDDFVARYARSIAQQIYPEGHPISWEYLASTPSPFDDFRPTALLVKVAIPDELLPSVDARIRASYTADEPEEETE